MKAYSSHRLPKAKTLNGHSTKWKAMWQPLLIVLSGRWTFLTDVKQTIKETSNTNWMTMISEASRWQSTQPFSPSTCVPLNEGVILYITGFRFLNDSVLADKWQLTSHAASQCRAVWHEATIYYTSTKMNKTLSRIMFNTYCGLSFMSAYHHNTKLPSGFKWSTLLSLTCKGPNWISAGLLLHQWDITFILLILSDGPAIVACLWSVSFISLWVTRLIQIYYCLCSGGN